MTCNLICLQHKRHISPERGDTFLEETYFPDKNLHWKWRFHSRGVRTQTKQKRILPMNRVAFISLKWESPFLHDKVCFVQEVQSNCNFVLHRNIIISSTCIRSVTIISRVCFKLIIFLLDNMVFNYCTSNV